MRWLFCVACCLLTVGCCAACCSLVGVLFVVRRVLSRVVRFFFFLFDVCCVLFVASWCSCMCARASALFCRRLMFNVCC